MQDLISIAERPDGTVAVSMRELHVGLGVGRDFTNWAKQMFGYGFEEGTDFVEVLARSGENPSELGGRPRRDWALTLDSAKEIAMLQRTERGQQVRRYFIEAEKRLRERPALTGPELMARALIEAQEVMAAKDKEIEAARPKVEAFDAFMDADGCYSIGAVAKMLGKAQNRLFDDLRAAGVLIAKGHMRNTPYQQYMHHFRVSAYTYENRKDGTTGTSYTTKVRPSGVDYIRKKLGLASAPMLEVV